MKQAIIIFLSLLICGSPLLAQSKLLTTGDQSPIIQGANNKIKYLNHEKSVLNIPDELIPYLSGLLMLNKIDDHKKINEAVSIWISKYSQLKTSINNRLSGNERIHALKFLQEGNFAEVEKTLNIKTSYTSLVNVFSNSIQTNGAQSPIIIGDYNNVTLAVEKVIEYNLPEGITVNLLSELKTKDNSIQRLQGSLEDKETAIKNWVKRYKEVELLLKNSPDEIGKRAFVLFQKGNFSEALKELDKANGDEIVMAKNRLLKAKIMLLKFDYNNVDEQLNKIKLYYETSVPFVPTSENYLEYSKFLIDYKSEYLAAVPNLQIALNKSLDFKQKVQIYNYLAIAVGPADRLKAAEYLETGLRLLNEAEPLTDEELIEQKALILYNIGYNYSSAGGDKNLVNKTISYVLQALATNARIANNKTDRDKRSAVLNSFLGKCYYWTGDIDSATYYFRKAQAYMESELLQKPQLYFLLAGLYANMSEVMFAKGLKTEGLDYLQRARLLIEPRVNLSNKLAYGQLSSIYGSIVTYYSLLNIDSVQLYLLKLDDIVTPFVNTDPTNFEVSRAAIYADLGTAYNAQANYSRAIEYLEKGYKIFIKNLSTAQFNMPKFFTCTTQLNWAYLSTRQYDKAIVFNTNLLERVEEATVINATQFITVPPQVYSQLSSVYLYKGKHDSAVFYCKKALQPIEILVKQYPLLYINNYVTYTQQLIASFTAENDIDSISSAISQFSMTWNNIYSISDLADKNMRCIVAESISNFAFSFYQMEAPKIDSRVLQNYTNKFLDLAEEGFSKWPLNNESLIDIARIATFYSKRAYVENMYYNASIGNNTTMQQHDLSKCNYIKKTRKYLNKLPVNNVTVQTITQYIAQIPSQNCNE